MTVSNVLSKLSSAWKVAEPITASFSNIPDDDYIGDLKEMKLGTAKKGRTQVSVTWEIADGELAGKTQMQFYGLSDNNGNADPKGMGYFKNVCEVIGLDLPEDLNVWQEAMDEFVGSLTALYDIKAKTNSNGYQNIFINGISEYTKGVEGEEEEAAAEEELEVSEIVEEEVVVEEVEEEVQEVVAPKKKIVAKVVAKPVAKVAVQPAKKVVAVTQPVRKIVSLKR